MTIAERPEADGPMPRTEVGAVADHLIVDVYPVGVLANLLRAWRYLTARKFPATLQVSWRWRLGRAWTELRYARQSVGRHIRARNWRALKNTFNGYLAEPLEFPPGDYRRRCGSGWIKGRALRSLRRHLPADPCRDMSTWEVRS